MKSKNRRYCQRAHAIDRAYQRHGLILFESDLDEIGDLIASGRALKLQSAEPLGTAYVYGVTIKGLDLRVIYRDDYKSVITFLPQRGWEV